MGISQYSVYITSYFHHQKIDIDMQYGNLIMPIFMVSNSIFAPLAGFIEKKIGLYFTLILSSSLLELDIFLFMNQTSLLKSALLIIFSGFSNNIGMAVQEEIYIFIFQKKRISWFYITILFNFSSYNFKCYWRKNNKSRKIYFIQRRTILLFGNKQKYLKFYKIILILNPIALFLALLLIKKMIQIKIQNH